MHKARIASLLSLTEFIALEEIEGFDGEIGKGSFPLILLYDEERNYKGYVSLDDFGFPDCVSEAQRILDWHVDFAVAGMRAEDSVHLFTARTRLARLLEPIGDLAAEMDIAYRTAKHKAQRAKDAAFIVNKKQGESDSVSNAMARQSVIPFEDEVLTALEAKKNADALLKSVENTLHSMAGNIKQLQAEQANVRNQNRA